MRFGYVAGNHEWDWQMEERCPTRFHCTPDDITAADEEAFSFALPYYVGGLVLTILPVFVMSCKTMFCSREPLIVIGDHHLFAGDREEGAPLDPPVVLHAADREGPAVTI